MVTAQHETANRIFLRHPPLLPKVFKLLGVPLADRVEIEEIATDASEIRPLERRVDTVLRVSPPDGKGFVLAIEAQSRKVDGKEVSWAYYLSNAQTRELWRRIMAIRIEHPGAGTLIEETLNEGLSRGGILQGRKSVLRVLAARNIPVPDDVRERVDACTEPGLLDRWLDRAVTVAAAEQIFEETDA